MAKWYVLLRLLSAAMLLVELPDMAAAAKKPPGGRMNVIDRCWRRESNWQEHRDHLANCSVGYAGKMNNNVGQDLTWYTVTDPSDDAVNPQPGTLRHALTMVKGKKWVTFQQDMKIKLEKPLLVGSFTTIDGRGARVEISNGACLVLHEANDVIIHSLKIRGCRAQEAGEVRGPDGSVVNIGPADADAIRLMSCSKIWIDHNTLSDSADGLIDVTLGSTDITISNNVFKDQDKVMLLGHEDAFQSDQNMKVTVAYNRFGPNCRQRMPRVRIGYAHVVNNLYKGWGLYAIGGSSDPSVKSEANLFVAHKQGIKEITWRKSSKNGKKFKLHSVADLFENGASFKETSDGRAVKPNYNNEQVFKVAVAKNVRALTRSAGALKCPNLGRCV